MAESSRFQIKYPRRLQQELLICSAGHLVALVVLASLHQRIHHVITGQIYWPEGRSKGTRSITATSGGARKRIRGAEPPVKPNPRLTNIVI